MNTTTPPPLTVTSIGVAEYADRDVRFGLIHRPAVPDIKARRTRRVVPIICDSPLNAAKVIQFADGDTDAGDWCPKCWNVDANRCVVSIVRGPFCAYSSTARRGTPVCVDHGQLTRGHVDLGTARDVRDEHLRAGGAL